MTDELAYDTIALSFAMALDGITDVAYAMASHRGLDTPVQGLLGGLEQKLDFWTDLAYTEGVAGVAIVAVEEGATVDGDDVTVAQYGLLGRYAVYDHIVHGGADTPREGTSIGVRKTFEGRFCAVVANEFLGETIELSGCHSWPYGLAYFGQGGCHQHVGGPHQFNLVLSFQKYHFDRYSFRSV
jgi:hypothetical protein